MKDVTRHKYYCQLGEKVCGNFKKRGGPCKESCKKERYLYAAAHGDQIDCDYPFDYDDFEMSTGKEFIDFMVDSGFMR